MTTDPLHKHGRFFDIWSHFYQLGPFAWELRRIQRLAIERLNFMPGELVLDLGCGTGDGMARIAEAGPIAFGLDYSDGMLRKARIRPQAEGRLVRGDAGRLPFKTGVFDKVVCSNSFHHYPDHTAAIGELRRVLKKSGDLILVDPRRDNLFSWLLINVFERHVLRLTDVRIYSVKEWKQLLADAGFASAEIIIGHWWQPGAWAEVFIHAVA